MTITTVGASRPVIRRLDAHIVSQIRAGEVIERPASVVKELLENALDAGAKRVRVEITEGGTKLIRVVDDGAGISPDELALAFAEHATSKLRDANGLVNIRTLGFRGEALHAVASVSRVEAVSSVPNAEYAQTIIIDHGTTIESQLVAPSGGSRFSVHDLFANVPARRKHLRSTRSESAAVHQVVSQYAIAHPVVAFAYMSDSRPVLTTPGTGRVEDAFAACYGANLVDSMVPATRSGRVSVSGLVSTPGVTRSNRTAILVFVNGRPVRSPALIFAIEDAYSGLVMAGRHPLAVLHISLPPEDIDPNVHPAKTEVRFFAEREVFVAVRGAVQDALVGRDSIPQPRESLDEWAPSPTPVTMQEPVRIPYPPGISFDTEASSDSSVPPPPAQSLSLALPELRVFGQSANTFIVAEGPSGLYMIDQHAAHERVIFDQLVKRSGTPIVQPLLEPVRLELLAQQWATWEAHNAILSDVGFDVESFGGTECMVRCVPVAAGKPLSAGIVPALLDAIADAVSPEDIVNQALTVVACKAAVKSGDSLTVGEMQELVAQLDRTLNPRTCPHGRPTTIHISTERLEREFGRR